MSRTPHPSGAKPRAASPTHDRSPPAGWPLLAGILLVSLCALTIELVLVRLFSVLAHYHFAFLSISIALFGISLSGVFVHVLSRRVVSIEAGRMLPRLALLLALSVFLATAVLLSLNLDFSRGWRALPNLLAIYLACALPFLFSGMCVALALRHFTEQVSRVYAADLIGAGLGCVAVIPLLSILPAPDAMLAVGVLACGAGIAFSASGGARADRPLASVALVLAAALLALNLQADVLQVRYVKGQRQPPLLWKQWNAISRVDVRGLLNPARPSGWGLSEAYDGPAPADREYVITIDGFVGSPIAPFDGNLTHADYLRYDVTAVGYYGAPRGPSLIIGSGGGRDALASLVFGNHPVTAVEVNRAVVAPVLGKFAAYAGDIYRRPDVDLVIDDARHYVRRSEQRYAVIQASLVDTFAASASGALVLTESNLYTLQAFQSYLAHLAPNGIMTFSRWRHELPRLVVLTRQALESSGAGAASARVIVVAASDDPNAVATVVASREPLTADQVRAVTDAARRLRFLIPYAPGVRGDDEIAALIETADLERLLHSMDEDLSAPTDDCPFFFSTVRLRDFFSIAHLFGRFGETGPIALLAQLLVVVAVLVVLFIIAPMSFAGRLGHTPPTAAALLIYFSCLGLGFMLVEIPLIQRFILFLGHPIYALSVILFSLLVFGGIGASLTARWAPEHAARAAAAAAGLLVVLLLFYILPLPALLARLIGLEPAARVAVAAGLLLPIGLVMGMPFPLGLKIANVRSAEIIPWLWA
ncbi:MAG: hypothetical protein JSV65_16215, partial [Armatimonadota bacterium]